MIKLVRVDHRLLHGQVIFSCGLNSMILTILLWLITKFQEIQCL
nr:PTS sugar transporter subunit IIB [Enterococcus faecium]